MTKQKRALKKVERKRRASARNRAVKALAAGAMIAAGTQAYAAPVRFDNPPPGEPNHFNWDNAGYSYERALYVHLPPEMQGGDMYTYQGSYGTYILTGPRAFLQSDEWYYYGWNEGVVQAAETFNPNGARVQASLWVNGYIWDSGPGGIIPSPGAVWADNGSYTYWSMGKIRNPVTDETLLPPPGAPGYIGVKIPDLDGGAGFHYGWIGVIRNGGAPGAEGLQAFAWGYETDIGVPINAGAPEPGTLALLAFGAGAAATRRRKN